MDALALLQRADSVHFTTTYSYFSGTALLSLTATSLLPNSCPRNPCIGHATAVHQAEGHGHSTRVGCSSPGCCGKAGTAGSLTINTHLPDRLKAQCRNWKRSTTSCSLRYVVLWKSCHTSMCISRTLGCLSLATCSDASNRLFATVNYSNVFQTGALCSCVVRTDWNNAGSFVVALCAALYTTNS